MPGSAAGANPLTRTLHSFGRFELPFFGNDAGVPNAASASNNYQRAGLWRAFSYESQTSVKTYSGGAPASQQKHTPFGSHRGGGDITQASLDYTGQRLDGTGLLYYHARYYDPALGRFVSPDTVVPDVGALVVAPKLPP